MGKFSAPGNRPAAAYRQDADSIEFRGNGSGVSNPMEMLRRKFLTLGALGFVLAGAFGSPAWPAAGRAVKIIIPYPPGGAADVLARILAEQIGKANGQTMIVENHPGGGASIAYELAARAAPDGNTIVVASNSVVINPLLRKTNYDPVTSYEPVCNLVSSPMIFVVNSASPYKTIGDLIAAAHAKPDAISLAALGPATTQHIAVEQFKRATKSAMLFVPYPGGAPTVTALLGQHVDSALVNYSEAVEQLKAGKLRALATASSQRIKLLPDVPTVAESGYPGYESEVWLGLLAPAGTPAERIAELTGWFAAAVKAPEVEAKLLTLGLYPAPLCGKDFAAFIQHKQNEYQGIVREADIKLQ